MFTKKAIGLVLAVSVLGNLLLLYHTVDQAVTIDHNYSELQRREGQVQAATKLLRPIVRGTSQASLIDTAQKEKLEVLPSEPAELYVGGLKFVVENGKISDFAFE